MYTMYWDQGVNIVNGVVDIPNSVTITEEENQTVMAALIAGKDIVKSGNSFVIQDKVIVPPTIEELRERMVCTPAQMRLTLYAMDLLTTVDAIAASDTQANIVWQYATQIYRNSPFIANLLDNPIQSFTPEQVDALFIAAMGLDI